MALSIFVWVAIGAGATLLIAALFAYCFIKRYTDPEEAHGLVTLMGTIGISVTLFCVLIIPIDIYTVSYDLASDGSHNDLAVVTQAADFLNFCYYGLYCALIFFAFVGFPFAYFYFEEDSDEENTSGRCCAALKYTIGFVIIFVVLIIIGAVLKKNNGGTSDDWKHDIESQFTQAKSILYFTLGVLSIFGMTFWASYGAYGLAALPLNLLRSAQIRGNCCCRQGDQRVGHAKADLAVNEEDQRFLTARYDDASISTWKKEDRLQYGKLKKEQRELNRIADGDVIDDRSGCVDRCWNWCTPCRMVIAIVCFVLSLLIVVSMSLSSIDRLLHSDCGMSCAYAISKPVLINPIDATLKALHGLFPLLDFALFGVITLYIFIASIAGLVSLGVRLCMYQLYPFKTHRTMPHALLMGAWMLMFLALVINFQALTLSPQYAAFGTQFYLSEATNSTEVEKIPCSMLRTNITINDICRPTQVSKFINTLNIQLPFFGLVSFFANLVFIGAYFLFGIIALIRARKPYDAVSPDSDALLWNDV